MEHEFEMNKHRGDVLILEEETGMTRYLFANSL